jgi:hypothetical protein
VLQSGFSFAVSLGLHVALLSPMVIWAWLNRAIEDSPGDEGLQDGPVGDGGSEMALGEPVPMEVSLYVEPTVTPVAAVVSTPTQAPGPPAAAATTPAPKGDAQGDTNTQPDPDATHAGAPGHKPRGDKKPCDTIDEITTTGPSSWRVERDVVDWYATHLNELGKQVAVNTHRDANGVVDGFRVFLPRCSVLRQAGIKHGDIVHTVNGRRVTSLPEALAAYLVLRTNPNIEVEGVRKSGEGFDYRYVLVK